MAIVSILALVQIGAVTLAALPTNTYSQAAAPVTSFVHPYFTQNWRLFAPSPVASDRTVLMQGAFLGSDGSVQTTPWIDWTSVELDVVRHHLVGHRAGYVTAKLYGTLSARLAALDERQRTAATRDDPAEVPTWPELRTELLGPPADGTEPSDPAVSAFLRYEAAMTRLTSEVLDSRWPERNVVAVRFALRSQGVTPYEDRHGSAEERELARPPAQQTIRGWREPLYGTAAERGAVADFERRHR